MGQNLRVGAMVTLILAFLALKVFFLFRAPKALAWATVPALLLILSSPQKVGAAAK